MIIHEYPQLPPKPRSLITDVLIDEIVRLTLSFVQVRSLSSNGCLLNSRQNESFIIV